MQALNDHLAKDGFRLRGTAMSRVDAFSDVIFGFALTLLVVSLEVPHTFEELHHSLRGFIPFAICFTLLILIWYSHFKFFRRYGLHDLGTIAINSALLFVVLFYVYPLKFLFTVLTAGWVSQDNAAFGTGGQMRELMLLYSVGFTAVYSFFIALYWNALRQKRHLTLNPREEFLTRSSMIEYALMTSVGIISILIALFAPSNVSGLAGFVYIALAIIGPIHGRWEHRRLLRLGPASH
ncbi:TMEM175 family protein [Granulicella paludicola]|uniref:TMEM175 family protein n=1 Tax=Granulicella paludicola TaxID=474951 RepID=UPI0021DF758F|nr:TMEM175 family protein [Granulicella paludicola]